MRFPTRSAAMVAVCSLWGAWLSHAAPPLDAEIPAQADAIAAQYLQRPGAVGLSIAIAHHGRIFLAKAYGLADAEFDVPADKDTVFRIGSVTKEFTAAAVMRLVEQNKLSLDDDLSTYVPDFPLQGNHVTIRQLLNHTSGIANYTDLEAWGRAIPLELTHAEVLALVKDNPFTSKPGEKWAYSNTAYHLLGMVIEKASGVGYAQFLQDEFFTPLGLQRTRLDSNTTLIKNRAQGYTLDQGQLANDLPFGTSQPFSAGSLLSTAEDLVKWSMALTSGKAIKPESFAQMATSTILKDGEDAAYGLGLQVDEWEGRRRVRHGGLIFGFSAMLVCFPDDDLHIAVISNAQPISSSEIAGTIARQVLGIEPVAAKDLPVPAELMARIAGVYMLWGRRIEISASGAKAVLRDQGTFQLLWQGPTAGGDSARGREFRPSFDPNVRFIFAADGRWFTIYDEGGLTKANRVPE